MKYYGFKKFLFTAAISTGLLMSSNSYNNNLKISNLYKSLTTNNKILCLGEQKKYHDLYIWGNGSADHTSDYSNFHPHKIEKFYDIQGNDISDKFKRIKQVEFGDYFTAVVNDNDELYIWITPFITGDKRENLDSTTDFKLNSILYSDNNIRKGIIKVSDNLKVNEVKFTKNRLFFTDKKKKLYMYSLIIGEIDNDSLYIVGPQIPQELNISSKLIEIKEVNNVKQIESGNDHLMILQDNGDVWGMGDDSFGQLGLGTFTEERIKQMKTYGNFVKRREKIPKKLNISNIQKISCGGNHTLFLDDKNNVYGSGFNRFLQLSNDELYREKIIGLNKPTFINKVSSSSLAELRGDSTIHINRRVIDFTCSKNCSFFVVGGKIIKSDNDFVEPIKNNYDFYEIYGCGEGLKGVLGINHIKHLADVEILPDISGLKNQINDKPIEVKSFKCGDNHCLLLFKNPRVIFSWGNNEYGELGCKNRAFSESPLPMLEEFIIPNNIIKVFAGKHNSAFICESLDSHKINELIEKDNYNIESDIKKVKEEKQKKRLKKKEKMDKQSKENEKYEENEEESQVTKQSQEKSTFNNIISSIKKYI